MIVLDTQHSARFYTRTLGFKLVDQGPAVSNLDRQPQWVLLRRAETELLLHARASWPAHVVELRPGARLSLTLPGDHAQTLVDPDGVWIEVVPDAGESYVRRAA
jgi:catechol 2,3-dioxygenase-like lactoylglutathione lyase family enzyme